MQNSLVIDSHHHFLDPVRLRYHWINDKVAAINRYFGVEDLRPLLAASGVDKTILVQCYSGPEETIQLCAVAETTDFIAGVVGWTDLTDSSIAKNLRKLTEFPGGNKLVGIRHQVDEVEADPSWLLRDDVRYSLQAIGEAGLAYEFLVHTSWLSAALKTARDFPHIRFVIDHLANPPIRTGEIKLWAEAMAPFSELKNVYCKVSGMIENADWSNWKPDDLVPYVQHVLKWFGEDRLMFGSNWPVCQLAGSYAQVFDALVYALGDISSQAKAKIFGTNAVNVYRLS